MVVLLITALFIAALLTAKLVMTVPLAP